MSETALQLICIFSTLMIFLLLRFPMFVSLLLSCASYMLIWGDIPLYIVGQGMFKGINSLSLAAMGFYFMLGSVMSQTSLSDRLSDFCQSLIGHFRGGLSHVNVLVSIVFAGVSGSATADVASEGSWVIPMMKKVGYPAGYACAVTEVSALIGPIIPPSTAFILFSTFFGVSTRKMFIAGIIPGLLLGLGQLVVSFWMSYKYNFPREEWKGWGYVWKMAKRGLPSFLLPALVMVCLICGIGTVLEIGAISATVAVILATAYGEMSWKKLYGCLKDSARMMANVVPMLAVSGLFTYILAIIGVTHSINDMLTMFGTSPAAVTIFVMSAFFLLGMIMDSSILQIVVMPILASSILALGIDANWFCVIATLVIQMGLITPPVGNLLYITSAIGECSPIETIKYSMPYIIVMVGLVLLFIFCPGIITWLPSIVV